ncbi:ribonuclease III [Legionella hackeliae]|uniref:Ribonuclease 3 n=1 Tax=Legionella hackeliae TaxID=449 RepID=A0A0A8USJ3_LEGHA|nr:ribonuclease III [Legionella hackeliae]KTD10539.1 ribonuclease III [Legionella hackeliae]CEK10042.1 Ribonuclease 3 [Legionella hackeliae]STX46768.1 ribonuclease III [Legionella hackeliae]
MGSSDLQRLCRRLGYQFKNPAFLKQALTHCSAGSLNNERYEFLGDSILSFVIAHALFSEFPEQTEGQLSRLRAFLVKGEMLAEIATEIELGDHLFLGQGELKSGGFRRASILADALEAVIAAVFLDGGIEASKQLVLRLYQSRFEDETLHDNLKDAKTQLQEYLQAHKKPLPEYSLAKVEGEEHDQLFYVTCKVSGRKNPTLGCGSNRRKAEQEAAKQLLQELKGNSL